MRLASCKTNTRVQDIGPHKQQLQTPPESPLVSQSTRSTPNSQQHDVASNKKSPSGGPHGWYSFDCRLPAKSYASNSCPFAVTESQHTITTTTVHATKSRSRHFQSLYRGRVQHDSDGRTERLWWEVASELCAYYTGVSCIAS